MQMDRLFTGQRQMSTLGIYDYNARFYSPLLGRFLSADTIVPNAGNPQALNHYSYVLNNPLLYVDPSGRICQRYASYRGTRTLSDDECEYGVYTHLNASKLSPQKHQVASRYISARDVYSYYLTLWAQDGWWKDFLGGGTDGFSIWDYLSIYAFNEGEYHADYATTMAQAAAREYYQRAKEGYHTNDIYGLLDWWAGFSQSEVHDVLDNKLPVQYGTKADYGAFSIFGARLANPPADWRAGADRESPYGWGNASAYARYSATAPAMLKANAHNPKVIFIFIDGDDPFYVPSFCARLNWVDNPGNDPNVCN